MSKFYALMYLITRLMESEDPVTTLLALNPLEQAGLAALALAGIAMVIKLFGKRK